MLTGIEISGVFKKCCTDTIVGGKNQRKFRFLPSKMPGFDVQFRQFLIRFPAKFLRRP